MKTQHRDLRDELVAILGAGRELTPDSDEQLADAFLRYLEHQTEPETAEVVPVDVPHQPHYSLRVAGGFWGAALMFLFLLLLLDNPHPITFIVVSVVLLSFVAALTRVFLYLARSGWKLPRVHVEVAPPSGKPHSRG